MQLIAKSPLGDLKVLQYPMPIKGNAVWLKVNGEEIEGRVTSGRGQSYTYFPFLGKEVYVPGALEDNAELEIAVPEGFAFRDLKVKSRKEQYEALKAKRPAKPEGEQAAESGGEQIETEAKPKVVRVKKAKVAPAAPSGEPVGDAIE